MHKRNINLFGMTFIIAFWFVIMLVDVLLLKFLIFIRRFRKSPSLRINAWIQDGVFQLQRKAYQVHSKGKWIRLDREVPVTAGRFDFANLPFKSQSKPDQSISTQSACSSPHSMPRQHSTSFIIASQVQRHDDGEAAERTICEHVTAAVTP